jgi:hypothetical protein
MKRDTYLSLMLTATVVLLSADLTARYVASSPLLDTAAYGQVGRAPTRGAGSASTLAFEQRKEMIKLLKSLNGEVAALRGDLKAGTITVKGVPIP